MSSDPVPSGYGPSDVTSIPVPGLAGNPTQALPGSSEDTSMAGPAKPTISGKTPIVLKPSVLGIENAKKRLRAFSIQKKQTPGPMGLPGTQKSGGGQSAVVIGKLPSGIPKRAAPSTNADGDFAEKVERPPRLGKSKKSYTVSIQEMRTRTVAEIEDIKRKMELVELGIPLGLMYPQQDEKSMPTKAMPPIKTFLDPAKIDEFIRESKKAKAEGKEIKFDYQKLLPDYENPFQRKKDDPSKKDEKELDKEKKDTKDKRTYDKYDPRSSDKDKYRTERNFNKRYEWDKKGDSKDKRDSYKDKREDNRNKRDDNRDKRDGKDKIVKGNKETDVDLTDYLVCDSWSLDTEGKNSPKPDKIQKKNLEKSLNSPLGKDKRELTKGSPFGKEVRQDSPLTKDNKHSSVKNSPLIKGMSPKLKKLKPVVDEFIYEIDSGDEEMESLPKNVLNIKSEQDPTALKELNKSIREKVLSRFIKSDPIVQSTEKQKDVSKKDIPIYDATVQSSKDNLTKLKQDNKRDQDRSYSPSLSSSKTKDEIYDPEQLSDNISIERSMNVQFQPSPDLNDSIDYTKNRNNFNKDRNVFDNNKNEFNKDKNDFNKDNNDNKKEKIEKIKDKRSATKDINEKNIKDKIKNNKSIDESMDCDPVTPEFAEDQDKNSTLQKNNENNVSNEMVNSLDTWNFVLKICQPLLFRHDRNKCYRETRTTPSIWYTENPKICTCVNDRSVVYEELEACKMSLVDRLYGCDQILDAAIPHLKTWYPTINYSLADRSLIQLSTNWETDDSSQNSIKTPKKQPFSTASDDLTETEKNKKKLFAAMSDEMKNKMFSTLSDDKKPFSTSSDDMNLDLEYQRFMNAVWPEVVENPKFTEKGWSDRSDSVEKMKQKKSDWSEKVEKSETSSVKSGGTSELGTSIDDSAYSIDSISEKSSKKHKEKVSKKKATSEYWSQESVVSDEEKKSKKKQKENTKTDKELKKKKKKRRSTSSSSDSSSGEDSESESDTEDKEKKKRKKMSVKAKEKAKKRREKRKKEKRLKDKKKKKLKDKDKKEMIEESPEENVSKKEKSKKKEEKKVKDKKRQNKTKKKESKKKKKYSSSSSETSTDSSSDSESEQEKKQKRKKIKKKEMELKRKKKLKSKKEQKIDLEILKNIKTERVSDDEKNSSKKLFEQDFSPRRKNIPNQPEIISVTELHSDFTQIAIKRERVDDVSNDSQNSMHTPEFEMEVEPLKLGDELKVEENVEEKIEEKIEEKVEENIEEKIEGKVIESIEPQPTEFKETPENSNSQNSSQDSSYGKENLNNYEKDMNFLRPSSQNSNYSFRDVITSESCEKTITYNVSEKIYDSSEKHTYSNDERVENYDYSYEHDFPYENQMDQSLVESSHEDSMAAPRRIETVISSTGSRGEIKCDWRPNEQSGHKTETSKPSRWGMQSKPGEANIILTGQDNKDEYPIQHVEPQKTYKIETISSRITGNMDEVVGYDEAYADMYAEADQLKYGDCFSTPTEQEAMEHINARHRLSLDDRIDMVLKDTGLGGATKEDKSSEIQTSDKGILLNKVPEIIRPLKRQALKRVSFADGYHPGQDSDTEQPPKKKKKWRIRLGCAWPCPASHPDHVPVWDALPPPPPPPGSPPPPPAPPPPPPALLRRRPKPPLLPLPPHHQKYPDMGSLPGLPMPLDTSQMITRLPPGLAHTN